MSYKHSELYIWRTSSSYYYYLCLFLFFFFFRRFFLYFVYLLWYAMRTLRCVCLFFRTSSSLLLLVGACVQSSVSRFYYFPRNHFTDVCVRVYIAVYTYDAVYKCNTLTAPETLCHKIQLNYIQNTHRANCFVQRTNLARIMSFSE